jgi:endoglycosylceramidase
MHALKILMLFLITSVSIISCKKDKNSSENIDALDTEFGPFIADEYGRQLILHGLNTSSGAKSSVDRMPWIKEYHVENEASKYGFNYVRYLIFWDFIEPEQGVYNTEYLNQVQERVEWYTSRGMYVMLDMHQDIYSEVFTGDGAPAWAVRPDGASLDVTMDGPWWLKNISPAVVNSWKNFWGYSKHKDLQDDYIQSWKFVAERFKSNPKVIGYDLMNEPWAGDLVKAFITGDFERTQLSAFYNRIIPALRSIETQKYLFFEPTPAPVTFGAPSYLPKINDANGVNKLVYAPHLYPYSLHEGGPYTAKDQKNVKDWHRERLKEIKKHGNIPLVCGEFGLSPNSEGYDRYLNDVHEIFDTNLWHWAYWSNDDGNWSPLTHADEETPILKELIRAYPKATAGRIRSFNYNKEENIFTMDYVSKSNISQPTEIFIPNRFFTNGFNVEVETTAKYHYDYNEKNQVVSLYVEGQADVKVTISGI